jgi:hypothetical protein
MQLVRSTGGCLRFAALGAALAGCRAKVDTHELEGNLRAKTVEMGLHATRIACPDDVEAKPGRVFACRIELDGVKTYALDVTIKRVDPAKAHVDFDTAWHDGPAVQVARLAPALTAEIGKSLGAPVTLACGTDPLQFLDADRKLHCQLTASGVTTAVTVDFDPALAATDWHLDPPLLAKAKLEELLTPAVRDKAGANVAIDCGPAAFVRRPADGTVLCAVTDGTHQGKLRVEVDARLALKRWEILP